MELSEVILALVGGLSTISAWIISNLSRDIKKVDEKLRSCQMALGEKFVQKGEYYFDVTDLKKELREQSKKIDQIWQHMRVDK